MTAPERDRSRSRSRSPAENIYDKTAPERDRSRSRSRSPANKERSGSSIDDSTAPVRDRSRSRSRSPANERSRSRSRSPPPARERSRSRSKSPPPSASSQSKSPLLSTASLKTDQRVERNKIGAIKTHSAFKQAGQKPGLEIWRLEQSEPVRQDVKWYGTFYSGDCYIILQTMEIHGINKFNYNLHFWLGSECTQEDTYSVSLKTMELDELVLKGLAVQYREVQSHETSLFLSYFKNNIRYLIGGERSEVKGKAKNKKRLFQVKGKKNIRIAEVPCRCGSLNQGDTFVLEDGSHIYCWIGPGSTRKEKLAGLSFSRLLKEEHDNKAFIHVVQDWNDNKEFYKALGSRDKAIKAADAHDDEDIIRKLDQQILLFRIENQSMFEIHRRPLKQNMLTSDGMFMLDSGPTGMYLWIGNNCPQDQKYHVWSTVQAFLDTRGYPYYLNVIAVREGREIEFFKQYFDAWYTKEIESDKKHRPHNTIQSWMPDDGEGKVKVYRMEHENLVRVPSRAHGVFFLSESYVVRYRMAVDEELYIIYIWQGSKSTMEEREAAIKQAIAMDEKYDWKAVQIRVVANKEPDHFIRLFKGRLIYLTKGHINGFRSLSDYEGYDPKQAYMYQIKGRMDSARGIQVAARPASLNSNHTYLIDAQRKRYIWIGKYAPNEETAVAKKILAEKLSEKGDPRIVEEGRESGILWSLLGGEEPYYTKRMSPKPKHNMPPRLFHCILISGMFTVEELINYSQDDLIDQDIMLLDTFDEIFMWIGRKSSEYEIQRVYRTAFTYLNVDPSNRTPDNTTVVVVKQGYEPTTFTGYFPSWDADRWHKIMRFKKVVQAIERENEEVKLDDGESVSIHTFYTYDELKRRDPPEGVDASRKEMYLSPEHFEVVFKMDKATFANLPEWKRISLKKRHALF